MQRYINLKCINNDKNQILLHCNIDDSKITFEALDFSGYNMLVIPSLTVACRLLLVRDGTETGDKNKGCSCTVLLV